MKEEEFGFGSDEIRKEQVLLSLVCISCNIQVGFDFNLLVVGFFFTIKWCVVDKVRWSFTIKKLLAQGKLIIPLINQITTKNVEGICYSIL